MREAAFSLAEAKFAAGDFRYKHARAHTHTLLMNDAVCVMHLTHILLFIYCFCSTTVIQNVNRAQVKVRAKKDNVAGLVGFLIL